MMFCIECGLQVDPEAKFCHSCGHRVIRIEEKDSSQGSFPQKSDTLEKSLSQDSSQDSFHQKSDTLEKSLSQGGRKSLDLLRTKYTEYHQKTKQSKKSIDSTSSCFSVNSSYTIGVQILDKFLKPVRRIFPSPDGPTGIVHIKVEGGRNLSEMEAQVRTQFPGCVVLACAMGEQEMENIPEDKKKHMTVKDLLAEKLKKHRKEIRLFCQLKGKDRRQILAAYKSPGSAVQNKRETSGAKTTKKTQIPVEEIFLSDEDDLDLLEIDTQMVDVPESPKTSMSKRSFKTATATRPSDLASTSSTNIMVDVPESPKTSMSKMSFKTATATRPSDLASTSSSNIMVDVPESPKTSMSKMSFKTATATRPSDLASTSSTNIMVDIPESPKTSMSKMSFKTATATRSSDLASTSSTNIMVDVPESPKTSMSKMSFKTATATRPSDLASTSSTNIMVDVPESPTTSMSKMSFKTATATRPSDLASTSSTNIMVDVPESPKTSMSKMSFKTATATRPSDLASTSSTNIIKDVLKSTNEDIPKTFQTGSCSSDSDSPFQIETRRQKKKRRDIEEVIADTKRRKLQRHTTAKDFLPTLSPDGKEIMVLNSKNDTIYSACFDPITSLKGLFNWIVASIKSDDIPTQFVLTCVPDCDVQECPHIFNLNVKEQRQILVRQLPSSLIITSTNDDPNCSLTCYDEVYFKYSDGV